MFFLHKKDRLALEYASAGILLSTVPFLNIPVAACSAAVLLTSHNDKQLAIAAIALFTALFVTPAFVLAPYALPLLLACLAIDAAESAYTTRYEFA